MPAAGLLSPAVGTPIMVGGVYNATTPMLQDKQGSMLNLDNEGNLLVSVVSGGGGGGGNVNVIEWAGTVLGAPSLFGTSPGAVNVIGTNSELFAGATALTATGTSLNVNITGGGGGSVTQGTVPWVDNITQIGGAAFSLGQQLAAASLPVVLTAAQISTLTPLSTVAVTQSTSPWIVAGGGTAGTPGTAVLTVQGISGGTTIPVTAAQATAANLNATVVGTGTFSVQVSNSPAVTGSGVFEVSPTTAANTKTNPFFTNIADGTNSMGAMANFGTSPTAVTSLNVNASIFSGTTALGAPNTFGATAPTGNALGVNAALFLGTTLVPATVLTAASTAPVATQPSINVSVTPNQPTAMFSGTVPGTAPSNTILTGTITNTTAPSATNGQTSPLQADYEGSLFVKPYRRSQTVAQATTISASTSTTTVLAAQATGIFADISTLIMTVVPGATTDTAFTATLSDGTNSYIFSMDTGALATAVGVPAPINLTFNPPLPATTAATIWTIALSSATPTVYITVVAVLQKSS